MKKTTIIDKWQKSLAALQTLSVEAATYSIANTGDQSQKDRVYSGHFVYDFPRYFCRINLHQSHHESADSSKYTFSFDGKYFYSEVPDAGSKILSRSSSRLVAAKYTSLLAAANPLIHQYVFAFNPSAPPTMEALKAEDTWESLRRRIGHLSSDGDKTVMTVGKRNAENVENKVYEVVIDNDTLQPVNWKETSPGNQRLHVELSVSASKGALLNKSTFPFPTELTELGYQDNTAIHRYKTVVDEKKLQVNMPVKQDVFTLHKGNNTTFVDEDKLQ